jgi:hypothetical protein
LWDKARTAISRRNKCSYNATDADVDTYSDLKVINAIYGGRGNTYQLKRESGAQRTERVQIGRNLEEGGGGKNKSMKT